MAMLSVSATCPGCRQQSCLCRQRAPWLPSAPRDTLCLLLPLTKHAAGARKGSLLERLAKDKGALGHLDQLQKLIGDMAAASGVGAAAPRAATAAQVRPAPATAQPQVNATVEQPAADVATPEAAASDAAGDAANNSTGSP
jgi:hypothetical protein